MDPLVVLLAVLLALGVIVLPLLVLIAPRPSRARPSAPPSPLVLVIDCGLRARPRVADRQAAAVAPVAPAAVPRCRGSAAAVAICHLPRGRRGGRRFGGAFDLVEVADGGTVAGLAGDHQADLVVLL